MLDFMISGDHRKREDIGFVGLSGSFIFTKCLNGIGSRFAQIVEDADQESIFEACSRIYGYRHKAAARPVNYLALWVAFARTLVWWF